MNQLGIRIIGFGAIAAVIIAGIAVFLFFGPARVNAQLADSPWPIFHGNARHTGLSPYDTSHVDGTVKWIFETGSSIVSSPVIDENGAIYFSADNGYLYAVKKDGSLKWKTKLGTPYKHGYGGYIGYSAFPSGSPTVDKNGNVYITTREQDIVAVDPSGNVKWRFTLNITFDHWGSPVIGDDGTIYVNGSPPDENFYPVDGSPYIRDNPPDGGLYALSPDGKEKWHHPVRFRMFNSPAMGKDGTIYIAVPTDYYARSLFAFNPNGTIQWELPLPIEIESSPTITDSGVIYIGSFTQSGDGSGLLAVTKDGTLWHYEVGGKEVLSTPAVAQDGTVYFGSFDGVNKVFAINPDGTEKWHYDVGGSIESSPAIGADGTIYFGVVTKYQGQPNFYAMNPDGTVKWKFTAKMHAGIGSSPAIGSDGTVYVGAGDGNLYAFGGPGEKGASVAEKEVSEEKTYQETRPATEPEGGKSAGTKDFEEPEMREEYQPEGADEKMMPEGERHETSVIKSFFQKIIDWFKRLFGFGEDERGGPSGSFPVQRSGEICLMKEEYESVRPILSMPFKLDDYYPKNWGIIPFCADPWKSGNLHNAIDFELNSAAKVYAAADGKVTNKSFSDVEGAGEIMQVQGDGFLLDYSGLKDIKVKIGEAMKKGDYIADVYETPYGEYHVHLGISIGERSECPIKYMDQKFKDALGQMFARAHYLRQDEEPCMCNCEYLGL